MTDAVLKSEADGGRTADPVDACPADLWTLPRSLLLDPLPPPPALPGDLNRRLGIAGTVAAGALILAMALALGDGAAWTYPFLWTHDFVWLPVRAAVIDAGFPYRLTLTLPLMLAALIAVVSVVLGLNPLRAAHVRITQEVLTRPALDPWLVAFQGFLVGTPLRPVQIELAVADARDRALVDLGAQAGPGAAQTAVRLARLSAALDANVPAEEETRLDQIATMMEAWLALDLDGGAPGSEAEGDHRRRLLNDAADRALGLAAARHGAASLAFAPETMAREAVLICRLIDRAGPSTTEELRELVDGVGARQRHMARLATSLGRGRILIDMLDAQPSPATARLGLTVALALARHRDCPEVALGYADAVEQLSFALALAEDRVAGDGAHGAEEDIRQACALTMGLPSIDQQRMIARLIEISRLSSLAGADHDGGLAGLVEETDRPVVGALTDLIGHAAGRFATAGRAVAGGRVR